MKVLYLECKMGIAGDMLASSLLGLFDDKEKLVDELNAINIPKVRFRLDEAMKCGIKGGHLTVLIDGEEETSEDVPDHHKDHDHHDHQDSNGDVEHHHEHGHSRTPRQIEEIIEGLNLSKEVRSDIREVYEILAEAESEVHGTSISEIHFHEVGNLDAIADIAAACFLMHELDPDKVIVSPINVGSGQVKTAHGILPVPAPATALLLKGIPSYSSDIVTGELCTPTGAALVKYFAFEFGSQPVMAMEKIGYGMGKKDFEQANCVRALLGEVNEDIDRIVELSCNIDDMTPEELAFAKEMLFDAGAVDVYTISIDMKKNRSGFLLTCMCKEDKKEALIRCIFRHTTTLGVRESMSNRYILSREVEKIDTPYGEMQVKRAFGYGTKREKLEYEDLAGIARRTGRSIMSLRKELEK
ncbi:nickel pincer cofactor biosynthesis protein LarC [Butyrivibrio sp. AE2032]|uniref:nickel pincer cofactor biosynthesis protein LarC n=1 Tax=Butyrivibrio sp. AE2032 TaxID=1458463 RepID=UPI00055374BA|nr:nickel pincer cofactor biosynthesis protein LarC [Butyrivibrio sp. AE2032]